MTTGLACAALGIAVSALGQIAALDPGAAASKPETGAVLPFAVDAIKLNDARRLKEGVRARATAGGRVELQDDEVTNALVDSSKSLGLDCDPRAAACAATFGRIADVDVVVAGSAVGYDARVAVQLAIVDVRTGAERARASTLLPADPDAEGAALDALFGVLEKPIRARKLAVEGAPAGARVVVDGVARGVLPLAGPVDGLLPGEHMLVVERDGFLPVRKVVVVGDGPPTVERVALARDPAQIEPGPSALQIATPFVVVAAGAGLAVLGSWGLVAGATPLVVRQAVIDRRAALDPDGASYAPLQSALYGAEDASITAFEQQGVWLLGGGGAAAFAGAGLVVFGATWGVLTIGEAIQAASVE